MTNTPSIPWLNKDSRTFLSRDYLREGMTPETRMRQIAEAAESILGVAGFADKFESYLHKGWYSLSSPIWSNFGAGRGLPISCFGSYVGDEVSQILTKQAEVGMMTKHGGGTSGYFGDIRGRGVTIKSGGKADGPVYFMRLFELVTQIISQSNVRRGSFAAYLPIDHPDILEFLQIRDEGNAIKDMSIGVTISDAWMAAMTAGDKDKRKVWGKVVQKRFESGYPYLFFSDTVNNNAPQVYKDKGLRIHASNLCVAPETPLLVATGDFKGIIEGGYVPISSVAGQEVMIHNGVEYTNATVAKTGENQPLLKVRLKVSGMMAKGDRELDVTPYHRFYDKDGVMIEAKDLKPGTVLEWWMEPLTNWIVSVEVVSVTDEGRTDDTYCVNEPKRHRVVFNDVLTGNCSEIMLSSSKDESFVCNLSSMNILHYDAWKGTDAVEVLTQFLDAVMTNFIDLVKDIPFMEAAHRFAVNQRALGIGTLGWHSYLQSKMVSFESMEAKLLNTQIHKLIRDKSQAASREMAVRYGESPLLKGYGLRNVTTMAIAPTTSSSFILGQVSPSIEPLDSNYYVKELAKGKFTYRNPYLDVLLTAKDRNTSTVWKDILQHGGSVQHLDFLTDHEKDVFKTFDEISQKEIVIQAAARQKYIDQSQSLNLRIHPKTPPKEVSELLIFAHSIGIRSVYYQRATNAAQTLSRSILTCKSCEA